MSGDVGFRRQAREDFLVLDIPVLFGDIGEAVQQHQAQREPMTPKLARERQIGTGIDQFVSFLSQGLFDVGVEGYAFHGHNPCVCRGRLPDRHMWRGGTGSLPVNCPAFTDGIMFIGEIQDRLEFLSATQYLSTSHSWGLDGRWRDFACVELAPERNAAYGLLQSRPVGGSFSKAPIMQCGPEMEYR